MGINMRRHLALTILLSAFAGSWWLSAEEAKIAVNRNELKRQFDSGNFKVALEGYRKLALDPGGDASQAPSDLNLAVQSLRNLGLLTEFDSLIEGRASLKPNPAIRMERKW